MVAQCQWQRWYVHALLRHEVEHVVLAPNEELCGDWDFFVHGASDSTVQLKQPNVERLVL